MTEEQFCDAQELLRDPDAEDCERFASRYGRALLDIARAAQALGAMPEGYCFCSRDRVGDERKVHEPECSALRAALTA